MDDYVSQPVVGLNIENYISQPVVGLVWRIMLVV